MAIRGLPEGSSLSELRPVRSRGPSGRSYVHHYENVVTGERVSARQYRQAQTGQTIEAQQGRQWRQVETRSRAGRSRRSYRFGSESRPRWGQLDNPAIFRAALRRISRETGARQVVQQFFVRLTDGRTQWISRVALIGDTLELLEGVTSMRDWLRSMFGEFEYPVEDLGAYDLQTFESSMRRAA